MRGVVGEWQLQRRCHQGYRRTSLPSLWEQGDCGKCNSDGHRVGEVVKINVVEQFEPQKRVETD